MTVWLLSSCALIAVLLLLRRLLKRRLDPRVTYALWLLAAVRILVPVSLFDLPVSVSGLAERSGLTQAVEEVRYTTEHDTLVSAPDTTQTPEDFRQTIEDNDALRDSFDGGQAEIVSVERDDSSGALVANVELTRDRFVLLRQIWCAGAVLAAVWFLHVNLRFAQQLRQRRVPCQGPLPLDCPLPVYVAEGLPSPCLFGLFHPAVYLNRAAADGGQLDHILTHELTHFRHRDHWWAAVRCLCLCVQWFNPLVWLAAVLSRQDCETACDAAAIARLGEGERLAYGRTLVDMIAAGQRRPHALFETATTMTGSPKRIFERVTLIAQKPKMTVLTLSAVLLAAAVAAGCAFGGADTGTETLGEEWYGTYVLDGERGGDGGGIVAPMFISYSPTADSIGPITISADVCAYQQEGGDFDPAAQDPGYQTVELDLSVYGDGDAYYPALDDFFGGYKSVQVYEVANAAHPTQLLVMDGELWLVLNAQENGAFFLRLAKSGGIMEKLAQLPEELADDVTVVMEEIDDSDPHFRARIHYYYTADYDPEEPYFANLLGVEQVTPGGFERYFFADGIYERPGWDGTYYYHITGPSDVQCSMENMDDYERVSTQLREWLRSVFENDESIRPVDAADTPFVDDFSYSGNHIDATVTALGSDEVICTLVLSQPVKQGTGGIWCVERVYRSGESEPQYILPESGDMSAADYYAMLQEMADNGQQIDSDIAGYDPDNAAIAYFYSEFDFEGAIGYGEIYSADKGAGRDEIGPAITGDTPAQLAQSVYDDIVGTEDGRRDFYLEVDDGGEVTRLSITAENGYNVGRSGSDMLDQEWASSFVGQSPSGVSVTLESADGDSRIQCWEDSDLVLLHQNGADTWLTAAPLYGDADSLYRRLMLIADDAIHHQINFGTTVDGSVSDYQQVVDQYMEQVAAAWRDAPDWVPSKPEDVQPGDNQVSSAYWGEYETFEADTRLYIQIDAESGDAGHWQAGAGLDEIAEGPYNTANGYYSFYLGRSFARNEAGDWVCTASFTGGYSLDLPTPVEAATVEQLVDYFCHTSGSAHDLLIPMELCDRSARELSALNGILAGYSDGEARQFCAALGLYLSEYAQYHELSYNDLYSLLDSRYAAWLKEGYEGTGLTQAELAEMDQWLNQSGNREIFWGGAANMDEADLALLLHDGADITDMQQDLPQQDKDLLARIGVDADLQLSEGVAVKVTGDQIKDYAWRRLGLNLTDEDLQERMTEWYYTPENDAFYHFGNGTSRIDVECLSGVEYSDGTLKLTVEANYTGGPQYVATLTPYGDSYRFVSVVPVS